MSYLHTRSPPIIHRDLKTPNVLLMSIDPAHNGPLAKVSDFGASAQMFMSSLQSGTIGDDDKAKKHVVTLTTWLAPEILVGLPYSKPSDVYAVGTNYAKFLWMISIFLYLILSFLSHTPLPPTPFISLSPHLLSFSLSLPSSLPLPFHRHHDVGGPYKATSLRPPGLYHE